jgi:3,4-dihydroxy 2-butanone 4-phosphate synthase / GTP cyclohydrolase II
MVRHTTGIICAPMSGDRVETLRLRQMVDDNQDAHGTAFMVSVDHVEAGTGVSAGDRATTLRALADPSTRAGDLRRPRNVFPLRAQPGGVSSAPGTRRQRPT